jgi:beta-glucanase (GH16 family)
LKDPDSQWELGWGWGTGSTSWPNEASVDHVAVEDGTLILSAEHVPGETPLGGVLHTKGNFEYGPGSYHEARVKIPEDDRYDSAFWSKTSRDPPEWPPEIDFYEFLGDRNKSTVAYTVHYVDGGGDPGGDHAIAYPEGRRFDSGRDLSDEFHTYGFEWRDEAMRWYFDGDLKCEIVPGDAGDSWNAEDTFTSCRKGAPFYTMLGAAPDATDPSEAITSQAEVEWVRSYEYDPDSGGGGGGDGDRSYLWARSANGDPFEFAFEASDGQIRLGSGGSASDYWVADDGTTAGGMTDKTGSLPGFYYYGEITSLLYRGPIELFDGGELVDLAAIGTNASNSITFDGSDGGSSYDLTVSGEIAKSKLNDASVDRNDAISGSTATGGVNGGRDSYMFSGEVTDFSYDGPLRVALNGEEIDPDSLASYEHTITFDGSDGQGPYELTVTGDIAKSEANGASINSNDEISGSTATGQVNGGKDSYEFNGDIQSVSADPSITVLVDGSEYEPGERVEVTRASDSGAVDYIIESNGAFETLDDGDESAGSKAHGVVMGGTDSYRLTGGKITDVSTFGGDVTVTVDGSELTE